MSAILTTLAFKPNGAHSSKPKSMKINVHHKSSCLAQYRPARLLERARASRRIKKLHRASKSDRFLLCRPKGGLNDCLWQVYQTIMHALRFHRVLIIDSENWGICDRFSNYFETILPFTNVETALADGMRSALDKVTCYPPSFRGKLDSYELDFSDRSGCFINRATSERPSIIIPDPPETLLLHDQCGGGEGWKALQFFKFTTEVAGIVTKRLSTLPSDYVALHIRAADTSLDYRKFLHLVRPRLKGQNILVCTDSVDAFQASADILDNSSIHQICPILDTGGERLHDNPRYTNRDSNIHALSDLVALAKAQKIFYPTGPGIHRSGYTALAEDLSSRNYILNQLLKTK